MNTRALSTLLALSLVAASRSSAAQPATPPPPQAAAAQAPAPSTTPAAQDAQPAQPATPPRPRVIHTPPSIAPSSTDLALRFSPDRPELIERVVVTWRTSHTGAWREVAIARDESAWSVTIPAQPATVRTLEYYVTVEPREGDPIAAFATRQRPHTVVFRLDDDDEQELRDLVTHRQNHLEFMVGGEYTSFGARPNVNGASCGRAAGDTCEDWWYLLYGEVRYRFHRRVRSVAVRVERLAGVTTRQEPLGPATRDVGLVSASTEVEFRVAPWMSASVTAILGANELSVQGGAGARVEIGTGSPARVQLSFFGITQYGLLGAAWMRWDTVPHTPLGAGVEITTQPGANADPGVRLLFEIGRRFGRHFTMTLRGGYGARREESSGFTGGGNLQLAF